MQSKKSFLEIFTSAVSIFKSSFWEIALAFCFSFPVLAIMYYTLWLTKPNQTEHILPFLLIFSIPYLYVFILSQTWQIFIIKDNIFTGVSNLLKTFKKSPLKSLQVYLLTIIFISIIALLAFMIAKALSTSYVKIFPLLSIPFIPFLMMFLAVILQDGKFLNASMNSITTCATNYFRILKYILPLILILFIVIYLGAKLSITPSFLLFATILIVLSHLIILPFYSCLLAELYFDLVIFDEEKPLEDLTELSESYPDAVDINQSQEEKEQKNPKNEIPAGLQQLGGNYEEKK